MIPTPDHLLIACPGQHARRMQMVSIHVVDGRTGHPRLDDRNRQVTQLHRLLQRLAGRVVFTQQVALLVIDIIGRASGGSLDDTFTASVVAIAGGHAGSRRSFHTSVDAIGVADGAITRQVARFVIGIDFARSGPRGGVHTVAGRTERIGIGRAAERDL